METDTKKTYTFGMIADNPRTISNYHRLGASDFAKENRINFIYISGEALNSVEGYGAQANILYNFIDKEIFDGILLSSSTVEQYTDAKNMKKFIDSLAPIPVVSIESAHENITSVLMENSKGIYEVVSHLIEEHGYKKIAFLRGPAGHAGAVHRYEAYVKALEDHGIPFDEKLVSPPSIRWEGQDVVEEIFDELFNRRGIKVEAIVGVCDALITDMLIYLQKNNYRIPEDFALAGFDNLEMSEGHTPPLTTVQPPFYNMGYKAASLLLDIIEGREVPKTVTLPSHMIIRQSCGCKSPHVIRASLNQEDITPEKAAADLSAHKEFLFKYTLDSLHNDLKEPEKPLKELIKAFINSWEADIDTIFLSTLENLMQKAIRRQEDASSWQDIFSAFKEYVYKNFNDPELHFFTDNLIHQARVMAGELAVRGQMFKLIIERGENRNMRQFEAELITTLDINGIMTILGDNLGGLSIPECYIALFDDTSPRRYPDPLPDNSELYLVLLNNKVIPSPKEKFKTTKLLPPGLFPEKRSFNYILQALYFHYTPIGYILIDGNQPVGDFYDFLRLQISTTLYGAILVDRLKQQTEEVTRQKNNLEVAREELQQAYHEISSLNEQLKDENISMKTEMELAARIQMALVPRDIHNLTEDFEVASMMLPAEEVGGDYHDLLLDGNGQLWIGIGDVSGHGVTPGLVMMISQTIHTCLISNWDYSPKVVMSKVNKILYKLVRERLQCEQYMTFSTFQYKGEGRFIYAGAHLSAIVYRHKQKTCEFLPITGTFLNIVEDISAFTEDKEFTVDNGDIIILYTDGITEVMNEKQQLFDTEGLINVIMSNADMDMKSLAEVIVEKAKEWAVKVDDDMTVITIRRLK